MGYLSNFVKTPVPQSEPLRKDQVKNNAGGFVWKIDPWKQLERFLIIGTEGGTYYASERDLTKESVDVVRWCIATDGFRVVDTVVAISEAGRAVKNDPALFVLALCASCESPMTRSYALDHLNQVARIGTHLFHFVEYVTAFRGWGRGLRQAITAWYDGHDDYQLVKYQSRDGWSHRDLLRLAHPKPTTQQQEISWKWVAKGWDALSEYEQKIAPTYIRGFELAKRAEGDYSPGGLIDAYNLTWEMLPTEWLRNPSVWKALLPHSGYTALLRNLGRLTNIGYLEPFGREELEYVVGRLVDEAELKRSRVHPIQVLAALMTYRNGHGQRGSLEWVPVAPIIVALEQAFYKSFQTIVPSGKRIMLALDVSGSMDYCECVGLPELRPRTASAVMAMATLKTEPYTMTTAFCDRLVPVALHSNMSLNEVQGTLDGLRFGSTDCALPMMYAKERRLDVDAFVVYTDNETWAGGVHPAEALRWYRQERVGDAKLVVVGMASNGFSIADPDDEGSMDIVGFDSAAPKLISDFIRGDL